MNAVPSSTHETDAERVARISASFPGWSAARVLSGCGHPGYGRKFAEQVLARVAAGGISIHAAILAAL